ncbi:uncharacterized protein PG998_012643 [Apiospora kogelbergensis]|uniref:uncharacterized protein n=1 Tax=Apiospora kogelbergensis TaxID=1337665 RepID=UPI00312FD172
MELHLHEEPQGIAGGCSAGSRTKSRQHQKIVVEPTAHQQTVYNRIRDELDRQQCHSHSQPLLKPPSSKAVPIPRARSSSRARASVSPSPVAEAPTQTFPEPSEPGKRPRGRRGGPLSAETRLRTAVKRSLGLVCNTCKARKCHCYDLSKLEDAYLASRKATALMPRPALENSRRIRSLSQSTTNDYLPYLAPEGGVPIPHELADSDLDEPLNSPQTPVSRLDVHRFASEFNVDSVRTGYGTLSASNTSYYNPGLGPMTAFEAISQPFAIGIEVLPCYSGRWRCEFPAHPNATSASAASVGCGWSGPLAELEHHWRSEHHAYRDPIISCHCLRCEAIQMVDQPPEQCESQNCSLLPGQWKRCMFGHTLVESTIASTPALTTGDSESAYSFDRLSPYG